MTGEGVDIGDELNLARAGSSAADAAREGDDKAAVAALIGTDLQEFRPGDAVEASPVEAVVGMVNLAGDGGHQCDLVGFAVGQTVDRGGKGGRLLGVFDIDSNQPAAFTEEDSRALSAILASVFAAI